MFGYNLYAYCGNNPVNRIDPSGEAWWHWALAATAVVALVTASIVTCGGAAAAAATAAAIVTGTCAVGVSTTAVVVTGAAVGASVMLAGSAAYAIENSSSVKEFADYGEQAVVNVEVGIVVGAAAGYINDKFFCFKEGTLIAAESGQVSIEDINIGDLVWATNTDTGETELKRVVQLFQNETNEWIHISVDEDEIVCTPGHPFYVKHRGWIEAAQLRAGDRLQKLNGEYVIVEQIQHELLESPERTYNFEVEDYHTYYVGESGLLVHNKCIDTYSNLRKIFKGTGKEVHHIIERRFAKMLNLRSSKMLSVALDPEVHQQFTNAWRKLIPYGKTFTLKMVRDAAEIIYKDYPDLLEAARKTLSGG